MTAVLSFESPIPSRPRHPAGTGRRPGPRPARRPARAVIRRRRALGALAGLGLVLTVARAGGALEGSPLATPERLPHVQTVVVQPGDTLWSIAPRLAPGRDRREVVDALVKARHTTELVPGEKIIWQES
jgi:Tfp pilus assembly protein FimV